MASAESFSEKLVRRHRASREQTRKWAGLSRQATIKDSFAREVLNAASATAFEIMFRAGRPLTVYPVAPGVAPSREQQLAMIFGMLIAVGICIEAKLDGVDVESNLLSAACAQGLPCFAFSRGTGRAWLGNEPTSSADHQWSQRLL